MLVRKPAWPLFLYWLRLLLLLLVMVIVVVVAAVVVVVVIDGGGGGGDVYIAGITFARCGGDM